MNAQAEIVLITCERGLGRMQASACAKRHKIANGGALTGHQRISGAAGIVNSPCRGCDHGAARVAAGDHKAAPTLVRAGDLGLTAPVARLRLHPTAPEPEQLEPEVVPTPQHEQARIGIERRLERDRTTLLSPAPSSGRACVVCGAPVTRKGDRGPVPLTCSLPCKERRDNDTRAAARRARKGVATTEQLDALLREPAPDPQTADPREDDQVELEHHDDQHESEDTMAKLSDERKNLKCVICGGKFDAKRGSAASSMAFWPMA